LLVEMDESSVRDFDESVVQMKEFASREKDEKDIFVMQFLLPLGLLWMLKIPLSEIKRRKAQVDG